jgi:hypothetical protein
MRAGVKEGQGVRPPCGQWYGAGAPWLDDRAGPGRAGAATGNAKQSERGNQIKTPPIENKSTS